MKPPWYRWAGTDLELLVYVQPGARSDEVAGLHADRLKIRIAAPPVDGRANRHLQAYLADQFGVGTGQVEVLSGAASRAKKIWIQTPKTNPDWFKRLSNTG